MKGFAFIGGTLYGVSQDVLDFFVLDPLSGARLFSIPIIRDDATLNGIQVEDGQIVEIKLDDKDKSKLKHDTHKIELGSFSLDITAVDSEGSTAALSVISSFDDLSECDDKKHEDKDHNDERDGDKKDDKKKDEDY